MRVRELHRIEVATGIRGLIFDCDGTLADTMPLHWKAWHECLAQWGAICPHAVLETFAGTPILETIHALNERFGWTIGAQDFLVAKKRNVLESLKSAVAIEPVVEIVRQNFGLIPMAVVSGGAREEVLTTLTALGLVDAFTCIITSDDGLPHKPSPEPFLIAARRMHVPAAECQLFEDADEGIEGGLSAGMVVTDVRQALAGTTFIRPE